MTTRNLTALLISIVMLCVALTASASVLTIGTTDLTIDLPNGIHSEALTAEDIADDMVAFYYNDDFELAIYQYDAEGASLEDLLEEINASDEISQSGTTTINGIDAVYCVGNETDGSDSYMYIEYICMSGSDMVEMVFVMDDASASQAAADIMNTLKR